LIPSPAVAAGPLDSWATFLRFDEGSTMRAHRYADRFSAVRVETIGRLPEAIHKSSSVEALLVSMSLQPVAAPAYRLWVDGKIVPTGEMPAFRANVIDLAAQPAVWADRGVEFVHFHAAETIWPPYSARRPSSTFIQQSDEDVEGVPLPLLDERCRRLGGDERIC
jgi:hypothetical protein